MEVKIVITFDEEIGQADQEYLTKIIVDAIQILGLESITDITWSS